MELPLTPRRGVAGGHYQNAWNKLSCDAGELFWQNVPNELIMYSEHWNNKVQPFDH